MQLTKKEWTKVIESIEKPVEANAELKRLIAELKKIRGVTVCSRSIHITFFGRWQISFSKLM